MRTLFKLVIGAGILFVGYKAYKTYWPKHKQVTKILGPESIPDHPNNLPTGKPPVKPEGL